jgi:SH3-like domain-containing protein
MTRPLPALAAVLPVLAGLLAAVPGTARAQEPDRCAAIYEAATVSMMEHCFTAPAATACAAAGEVTLEMRSGQVVTGVGSRAHLNGLAALRALPGDGTAWSLASLTVPDLVSSEQAATLLVLGPAELVFDETADLPPGAAFHLEAPAGPLPCAELARPGVLVQSPPNALTLLRVNGHDLAVNGLALIAMDGDALVVSALRRETILAQSGAVIFAGYSAAVSAQSVSPAAPYDPALVAHLPTEILPTIEVVALPGDGEVIQPTPLYSRPALQAASNAQAQAGRPISVLGRSSDGQWLHVRTYDGRIGWVPRAALDVRVPGEMPVYDEAPPLPVRPFGSLQGYVKTDAERSILRAGPGQEFDRVATVPFWTDLALYGRSADDQWLYVETGDGTRAWISTVLISPSTPYVLAELPYAPGAGG